MGFYPELRDLDLERLIERFHAPAPDGQEYAYPYYAEVALLVRQQGRAGIDFLHQAIDGADDDHLRAILFALGQRPRLKGGGLAETLRAFLHDERPLIVAEAVDGLWSQGDKDSAYDVLALREHPSPYVRGAILRFVSHLNPRCAPLLLIGALQDSDPIVRENAIDELHRLGAVETVPHLRPLLRDSHPDVRQAAQTAIEGLEWMASEQRAASD